jgi:hypothetical protein
VIQATNSLIEWTNRENEFKRQFMEQYGVQWSLESENEIREAENFEISWTKHELFLSEIHKKKK